jgi:3-hydroxyisobutyrate dehydrogenase
MNRVGFPGLGRMGVPMATNLARAGFHVALWNRTIEKAERLAAGIDAAVCRTPRQLAEQSEVVVTMLADDEASAFVHRGQDGMFAAIGGASYVIEMGTYGPGHVRQMAAEAGERVVIDAPVQAAEHAGFGDRDMASILNYLRGLK